MDSCFHCALPLPSSERMPALRGILSNQVPIYQSGNEAVKQFSDDLDVTVTLTAGEGLVEITEVPALVGQLRDIRGTIQISFGSEG